MLETSFLFFFLKKAGNSENVLHILFKCYTDILVADLKNKQAPRLGRGHCCCQENNYHVGETGEILTFLLMQQPCRLWCTLFQKLGAKQICFYTTKLLFLRKPPQARLWWSSIKSPKQYIKIGGSQGNPGRCMKASRCCGEAFPNIIEPEANNLHGNGLYSFIVALLKHSPS